MDGVVDGGSEGVIEERSDGGVEGWLHSAGLARTGLCRVLGKTRRMVVVVAVGSLLASWLAS